MMEVALRRSASTQRLYQSKKFALLLACASIVMLFAAFTSAYVVRKAAGNWLEFKLPSVFILSTVVLLLSSVTAHIGYKAFLQQKAVAFRWLTLMSFLLGIGFVVLQYIGWQRLMALGVPLDGNPSGSFVYVISGTHAAHVLGGLAAWFLSLRIAFQPFKFTEKRKLHLELVNIYWHFVDALWVYLIIFFILQ